MVVTGQQVVSKVARWPQSMAQYTVGHGKRVTEIEGRLIKMPGLQRAGNGYHGIGIPDCVRMGRDTATNIVARLGSRVVS